MPLFLKKSALRLITLFAFCLLGCSITWAQNLSANKAVVLRSEAELWSKGNLTVADELYSTDFVCHFVGGIEWKGLSGIKRAVQSHRASFPDWDEKVEDIIAEGDRVVIRITSTGTQRGEFAGIPQMCIRDRACTVWGAPEAFRTIAETTLSLAPAVLSVISPSAEVL